MAKSSTRTALALAALIGSACGLSACNTIAGAGQDVGAVGAGVTHGADAVKAGGT